MKLAAELALLPLSAAATYTTGLAFLAPGWLAADWLTLGAALWAMTAASFHLAYIQQKKNEQAPSFHGQNRFCAEGGCKMPTGENSLVKGEHASIVD